MSSHVPKRLYEIILHETGTTRQCDKYVTVAKSFAAALKHANEGCEKANKKIAEEEAEDLSPGEESMGPYCEVASVAYVRDVR